ncbi:MAG: sulfotransferase [Alphaproteobacteria bacterium]|nr:sulfotransferase [Alphaproteobacteria bacterium]
MKARIHFIAGLPRSGSTLLSALLRQNPRFHAGVTSPLAMLCGNLLHSMSGATEFAPFFTDERRAAMIRGIFDSYYGEIPEGQVVFDTNRTWTGKTALLGEIFPQARIICCVREVAWVIDSIEQLVRRNALQPSKIFNYKNGSSIYSRVTTLMDSDSGIVGVAWNTLREAWFSESAKQLLVIQYETLVRQPQRVIERVYEELDEPHFAHDFANVRYEEPDYDAQLGAPGLHKVRPKVEFTARETCLPPDLFAKYADVNFWAKPGLNKHKVTVL